MGGPGSGRGSGGSRPGAGRPRKSEFERAVTGDPGKRGRVLTLPQTGTESTTVPPAPDAFDPPAGLTKQVLEVWERLAPFAFANGTLVRATELAFVRLCQNVVLEAKLGRSASTAGTANHRGLIQRVDAALARFNLTPTGRPMYRTAQPKPAAEAPPVSKLKRFLK